MLDVPLDFFLGRTARATFKNLDDNPHNLPNGSAAFIEAVDSIGSIGIRHDKAVKLINYIWTVDPYYQWQMGYRYEGLRLLRLKQYDAALNEKFYNKKSDNFQKGIHFNDEL